MAIGSFEDAVKNRNWLNLTEYLLLLGSGVGSVATAASQQILYTAAPVTALFLLNLVNRRRIEITAYETTVNSVSQLDQKFSEDLGSLQKQVQALPSFLDLASFRKTLQSSQQEELTALAQQLAQLKQEVAKSNWQLIHQSMTQLQEYYNGLAESVNLIATQLTQIGDLKIPQHLEDLDGAIAQCRADLVSLRGALDQVQQDQKQANFRQLQDQINQLNRRLNQLPAPFDAAALKQDVNSLIKAMGDVASRRELSRLAGQMEQLSQRQETTEESLPPLRLATAILKKQVDMLSSRLHAIAQDSAAIMQAEPKAIADLRATINSLEARLNQLPTSDVTHLQAEVKTIVAAHVGQLRQQLRTVQTLTQDLEQQQRSLSDWVMQLPHLLDATALQNQMQQLANRVEWAESNRVDIAAQIDTAVKQQLEEVIQQVQPARPPYELVFDIKGGSQSSDANGCSSPAILEQALEAASARLVIVYPYPSPDTLSTGLIERFRAFLDRRGCLDIGWGYLGAINDYHQCRAIERRRRLNPVEKGFLYDTLDRLTQLKRQYPNQFRFKVLGTEENFLVCDRSYAILGAQSIFTASTVFPKAAVGLRTSDTEVIQRLVQRFDDPTLEETDTVAYLKRALTRYDLGDRQGAIADYTHVLTVNPGNDVAANNRGLARYDLSDRRGAIADFSLAIEQSPENFIAFCNRGYVRAELGDRLGAVEDYTLALRLNPDYAPAYLYRGLIRTRLRNQLGAIEDYNEVLRLNPEDAAAYFYRGIAFTKIGQTPNGIRDLHQAAQLYATQGNTASYQQVQKMLQKIEAGGEGLGEASLAIYL